MWQQRANRLWGWRLMWTLAAVFGSVQALCAQVRSVQVQAVTDGELGVAVVQLEFFRRGGPRPGELFLPPQPGKVLYPAWGNGPVRDALRGVLGIRARRATVAFLFRGREPFEAVIHAPGPIRVRVVPQPGDRRLLAAQWWRLWQPRPVARLLEPRNENYPPLVDHYLGLMLTHRLGFPPATPRLRTAWNPGLPAMEDLLGPLTGTEQLQLEFQRRLFAQAGVSAPRGPLPPFEPQHFRPEQLPQVEVEPLARYVPQECVYIRCGSFDNFLWLRRLMEQTGGDVRNLLAGRGVAYRLDEKIQQQLAMQYGPMSKVFGPLVVSDVALVATDGMMVQGAGVGLLFQVRNSFLFSAEVKRQRAEMHKQFPKAKEQTLRIAGEPVSFLFTPDGRLRSFYAVKDNVHLVTNSRWLVQRFLEAASGKGALAQCPSFRLARHHLPLKRQDTVFVHVSDRFFEHLASPSYRIEWYRRQQAVAALHLAQLAFLAGQAEGMEKPSLEQLSRAGLLPPGFGPLPDGSRTVLHSDGTATNDRRGALGFLVPIVDLPAQDATAEEVARYGQFLSQYRNQWGRMDPVSVALRRHGTDKNGKPQQIELEAWLAPFTHTQGFLARLDAPDRQRLRPVPGDLVSLEVNTRGDHLFAGLRDVAPVPRELNVLGRRHSTAWGLLLELLFGGPRFLVGYIGSTANGAGLQGWVDPRQFGPPNAQGLAPGPLGLWQRRVGSYTYFSFHPQVLLHVPPLVVMEPAPEPAQVRLHIGDLAETNAARFIDSLAYMQLRRTSQGNARFLNRLTEQLYVPPEQAPQVARRLLQAQLVCPLGGEYRLSAGLRPRWTSTAEAAPAVPKQGYYFAPINWLKDLQGELLLQNGTLRVKGRVRLVLPPDAERVQRDKRPPARPKQPPVEELPPPPEVRSR